MPVADSLTKSSKPLTTYLLTNGIPAINGQYDNWLKRKQAQSNQEVKKNYEGYLNTNRKLTQATNPNNLTIKDVALNYKGNKVIKDFDVRANGYFKYNVDILLVSLLTKCHVGEPSTKKYIIVKLNNCRTNIFNF